MSKLFEEIVKINLLAHVQAKCGGEKKNASDKTTHINPCPLCGHNDAFTYYFDTNSFKCFSCDEAGDIINFERIRLGLESNLEAAKSLAEKYGISIDEPKPPKISLVAPPVKPKKKKVAGPTIDPDRAKALRRLTANHYHQIYLSSPWAINYQTVTRGHKQKTLEQLNIGLFDGSLDFVKLVADNGFSETDLAAVSLLRPKKNGGYWPGIGKGNFIYPHYSKGEVLYFSIKDPNPIKANRDKWQPVKRGADPNWVLYNQDATEAATIWLVEGEDDCITCIDHGLKNTAATLGNFNTPHILDWLRRNSKDKTFILAFDPDKAGLEYQVKYAAAIQDGGGTVKTIRASLETFKDGGDTYVMT